MRTAVALDVGGTKLAAAVIGDDGAMLSRRQLPTPARGSAQVLGDAVLRLVGVGMVVSTLGADAGLFGAAALASASDGAARRLTMDGPAAGAWQRGAPARGRPGSRPGARSGGAR
jgi:predicted NBD/HSP70 family sugar kinase